MLLQNFPLKAAVHFTNRPKSMNLRLKAVAIATLALSFVSFRPTQASTLFSKAEVDSSRFVAVASPYAGGRLHQLLIIEQIADSRACWRESGAYPTAVDPLLVQFNFTGICGRSVDSNGYSIRMADQDLGWQYSMRVTKRNGDLWLVGVPTVNRSLPELQIGRTYGATSGFAKFFLNPGWRMTRRVYNGQPVGHVYLTNDRSLSSLAIAQPAPPTPVTPTRPVVSVPAPTPARPIAKPLPVTPVAKPPIGSQPSRSGQSQPQLNSGDYIVPTVVVYE